MCSFPASRRRCAELGHQHGPTLPICVTSGASTVIVRTPSSMVPPPSFLFVSLTACRVSRNRNRRHAQIQHLKSSRPRPGSTSAIQTVPGRGALPPRPRACFDISCPRASSGGTARPGAHLMPTTWRPDRGQPRPLRRAGCRAPSQRRSSRAHARAAFPAAHRQATPPTQVPKYRFQAAVADEFGPAGQMQNGQIRTDHPQRRLAPAVAPDGGSAPASHSSPTPMIKVLPSHGPAGPDVYAQPLAP